MPENFYKGLKIVEIFLLVLFFFVVGCNEFNKPSPKFTCSINQTVVNGDIVSVVVNFGENNIVLSSKEELDAFAKQLKSIVLEVETVSEKMLPIEKAQ